MFPKNIEIIKQNTIEVYLYPQNANISIKDKVDFDWPDKRYNPNFINKTSNKIVNPPLIEIFHNISGLNLFFAPNENPTIKTHFQKNKN